MAAGDNRFHGLQPPGYFSLMAALCKAHSGGPLFGGLRASAERELVVGEGYVNELVSNGAKEGLMTVGHCRRRIDSEYVPFLDG